MGATAVLVGTVQCCGMDVIHRCTIDTAAILSTNDPTCRIGIDGWHAHCHWGTSRRGRNQQVAR